MNVVTGLLPGFADPVLDAQRVFRGVMEALARPGSLQPLADLPEVPAPLTPELAAIALALADADAPLWLDAPLAGAPAVDLEPRLRLTAAEEEVRIGFVRVAGQHLTRSVDRRTEQGGVRADC